MKDVKKIQKSWSFSSVLDRSGGDAKSPRKRSSFFGRFGGGDSKNSESTLERRPSFFSRLKRRFSTTQLELPVPPESDSLPEENPTPEQLYRQITNNTPRQIRLQKSFSFRKEQTRRAKKEKKRLRKMYMTDSTNPLNEPPNRRKRRTIVSPGKSAIWGSGEQWPEDLKRYIEVQFEKNLRMCDLPYCHVPPPRKRKAKPKLQVVLSNSATIPSRRSLKGTRYPRKSPLAKSQKAETASNPIQESLFTPEAVENALSDVFAKQFPLSNADDSCGTQSGDEEISDDNAKLSQTDENRTAFSNHLLTTTDTQRTNTGDTGESSGTSEAPGESQTPEDTPPHTPEIQNVEPVAKQASGEENVITVTEVLEGKKWSAEALTEIHQIDLTKEESIPDASEMGTLQELIAIGETSI